jgi:catechol 2,3-dioxygenase-like lactoylglutathione lyase family enzyme
MAATTEIVTGVDFVTIPTRDLDRAVEFFGTTLGLDVAAARAALESRGVSFTGDILDTGVCHMAFFADPDGNAFMLHHRYAKRVPTG